MRATTTCRIMVLLIPALTLGFIGRGAHGEGGWPPGFTMQIELEKDHFLLGEPIWVDVELTYAGTDTVVMPYRPLCLGCGTFTVLVVSGVDTFPYSAGIPSWDAVSQTVPPGKRYERYFDLLEYYGVHLQGTRGFERELPPGDYTIQAWVWGARSDELRFAVVEPRGHDADIYMAMHQAVLLELEHKGREAASLLKDLLPAASGSAYRDEISFQITLALLPYPEEHLRACRDIADAGPDSRYARYAVLTLMRSKNSVEARAYLQELETRAPGTRAARAAAEALSKGWIMRENSSRDD